MFQNDVILKNRRGFNLHTTIVEPSNNKPRKLMLMAHGFMADRAEGGRFTELAHRLAVEGYYSVYLSFPGCGDSEEPFVNYSINNCLDDLDYVHKYMLMKYDIPETEVSIVGYSMGGNFACNYISNHKEIKNVVLWAAASENGILPFLFNGRDPYEMLNEALKEDYSTIKNMFDDSYMNYSYDFIKEFIESKSRDNISCFRGNVLLIHGDNDDIVPLSVSLETYENISSAKNKKLVVIPSANHGFGLWDDKLEQSEMLVETTKNFLINNV